MKIVFNNCTYTVKVKKVKTNSNYNMGVSIYFQNDNRPLMGSILKSGSTPSEIETWAMMQIKSETNPYFKKQLQTI